MTIQQLRAQIAALQDATMDENRNFRSAYDEGKFDALSAVDALLDSMQEEPQFKKLAGLQHVNETCKENGNSLTQEFVSDELKEAAKSYSNNLDNICGSIGKQTRNAFKAGAKWQKEKDESKTEDLGDYINELSKQFPEVSFAKLSRIAVRVAKWQKEKEYTCYEEAFEDGAEWKVENLWKPADGDDLPEIDREVIALTQPYPNDEHLRVVFAHRPNKYANVWNSDLGEEQVVEIERHGKGGWNTTNVKYWLDYNMDSIFKRNNENNKIDKR